MRKVADLPYGLTLLVDPSDGTPWFKRKGFATLSRPHEWRALEGERWRLQMELVKLEAMSSNENESWHGRMHDNAVVNARMTMELEPRPRRYAEEIR